MELAIRAPIRNEIPVGSTGRDLGNLVLSVQYTDELGWRQKSIGEIENGVAVLFGPAKPSASVAVEVRIRNTNSTFGDMKFSQVILHKQMTFGELLQGLVIPRFDRGEVTIATGQEDVEVSIRSALGSMLKRLQPNDTHRISLPMGEVWESRLAGSLPFTITKDSRIDAFSIVDIVGVRLDKYLAGLVDGRSFSINISSRFYRTMEFPMIPKNMRILEGGRCTGYIRVEGRSETIPFSGIVVGTTLRIKMDKD